MASRDDVKVMVLNDLAAICKKLADEPAVPGDLRAKAADFVSEYDALVQYRGRSNNFEHEAGEELLTRMARFLPDITFMMPDTTRSLEPTSDAL